MPLGTLRLAGANLHPHVAYSAHDVSLPLGGSEGHSPPPALPGTREAWPQGVSWLSLSCTKQARPPTLGILCGIPALCREHSELRGMWGEPRRSAQQISHHRANGAFRIGHVEREAGHPQIAIIDESEVERLVKRRRPWID